MTICQPTRGKSNVALNRKEGRKIKKILALDGKTIRGNAGKGKNALHVVSAYCREEGVCFGQKSSDSKGKEIPMIKELLNMLKVKGHIITIDAIGTQTEIAKQIVEGKADYVLAVKGNQECTEQTVAGFWENEELREGIPAKNYLKTSERARGQDEMREYYQTDDKDVLALLKKWEGIKSIGMVRTTIYHDDGSEPTVENRYYISSLKPNIKQFARAVRGHWAVEILHWYLDVVFREDASKILEQTIAENLNIARKWALSVLKLWDLEKKLSIASKRYMLNSASEKYLEAALGLGTE